MADDGQFETFLANCFEKYEQVRKLLEKKDPEQEPYKSRYEAKEILCSIKKDLVNYEDDIASTSQETENETVVRTKCITAAIHYKLGMISTETEEFSSGEEHLSKCLELVEGRELSRDCILLILQALNQIGILWSMRGELQKSLDFLKKAESLSKKYRKEVCVAPLDIEDLFSWKQVEDESCQTALEANWKIFEKTLTHTMYYLAQVYTNLEKTDRAAEYCHTTLRRQLETKDFDPLDWSINAATLSQFLLSHEHFEDARHHLACATYVLDNYESELRQQESKTDDFDKLLDTLRNRRADVARCWAKYGLLLLSMSWDDLMRQTVNEMVEDLNNVTVSDQTPDPIDTTNNQEQDAVVTFDKKSASGRHRMVFKSLEVTTLEEQLPIKYVLDFEQARSVFLNAQKWLNQAKEFYTLSDHASDHVLLVQDMSKLYKLLAYFENVEERQCKMHKRRIDMMEAVLKELNPQFYLTAVRQLQFELAETFSLLLDLKMGMLQDPACGSRSPHAINKVNHLAKEGIKYFQAFIDTFKDSSGKPPETYPEELLRPVLLAHFYIGRFNSKIISSDTDVTIAYLKKSYCMYKFLVDYCEKNPSARDAFKDEFEVTKEMVQLLPVKMDKFTAIAGV